jgi:hypothetical protein
MSRWKAIGASVPGQSHIRSGFGCDDAYGWRTSPQGTCLIVADGAGSAEHSALGSHAAVAACLDWTHRNGGADSGKSLRDAFAFARSELTSLAEREGLELRTLATTLGAVWHTGDQIQICQIGDTIIVRRDPDGFFVTVDPPEKFEYVNEAVFLTQDVAFEHVRSTTLPASQLSTVALSTDGLRYKILSDLATFEPFTPFFEDVFAFVRRPGATEASIAHFLDSLDDQTGDDKTLVLGVLDEAGTMDSEVVAFGPEPSLVGRTATGIHRDEDQSDDGPSAPQSPSPEVRRN